MTKADEHPLTELTNQIRSLLQAEAIDFLTPVEKALLLE
jgi:hypothetical protein